MVLCELLNQTDIHNCYLNVNARLRHHSTAMYRRLLHSIMPYSSHSYEMIESRCHGNSSFAD